MLDNPSSADFDRDALAETQALLHVGMLPDAPLAMPKQVLEVKRARLSAVPLLRLFGASTPRPGL